MTLAVRHFKEKKAEEVAKEMLEDKILRIKERNELKVAKVAQRKAKIESEKERKRLMLLEKERIEMSPLRDNAFGNSQMMRTFNVSASHNDRAFSNKHNSHQVKHENSTDRDVRINIGARKSHGFAGELSPNGGS